MGATIAIWLAAVLFHALVASSPALLFKLGPAEQWMQAMNDSPKKCRVFLVGSSPVTFGLSASKIQAATGCATVNLGLLNLGNQVTEYLETVLQYVKPGDFVVLTDRRWTEASPQPSTCAESSDWRCFLASIRWAPVMAEDWRMLTNTGLPRSIQGDLTRFPTLDGRVLPVTATSLEQMAYRLKRIARQLALIKERGAHPLLAAAPILVTEQAMPALEAEFSMLEAQIRNAHVDAIWLGPRLEKDLALFVLEGQHASEAGRDRWSQAVQAELLSALSMHAAR